MKSNAANQIFVLFTIALSLFPVVALASERPNIVFILTDDHRWDCYGDAGLLPIATPNLDRIAEHGTRFDQAFVTLAICSPSRAACLTGRYGSANGVTAVGKQSLAVGERTFAHALRENGYRTGVTGKWHLKSTPESCGFDFSSTCWANGTWYDRTFTIDGQRKKMPGFVDQVAASESVRFIQASVDEDKPFVLWLCTQVPHMDHRHTWPAGDEYLEKHSIDSMPLPTSWQDDLRGKPRYLRTARNRTRALEYGYADPDKLRAHIRDYRASVEQMDAAVGLVFEEIERRDLLDNTWFVFMGDNGWFLGEHGMTSKVLAYEESMRVPMAISGPETDRRVSESLVLNIDLTATIYDLAGLEVPDEVHGRSLLPIVRGKAPSDWRRSFLYEAPTPQLGSQPHWAIRNSNWKLIETQPESDTDPFTTELYDLSSDSAELRNLASDPVHQPTVELLTAELARLKQAMAQTAKKAVDVRPETPVRTDLKISGIYPHLTTYGVYSQGGAHFKEGHNECGIGAIVPWAGKLWMVNYAPHRPKGSEHKLSAVDPDLTQPLTIHPESVGGTPAGRMIHAESNQLLIGHHLIDSAGQVKTIQPSSMPIRVTAIARHLRDPANLVYYVDMEGSIWEANVHTLQVKRLFKKPVPGWHGKGGYTSQGRLVVSNNGELHVGNYQDVLVGGKAVSPEERGVLAEYDGEAWKIVERRQFTEVTGPKGINGGSDGDDPIWTMGWDRRSVRLKVLDDGQWHTYLLPKAAYCNDANHGWYTEWPRIREITDGRWMMDMHGMFFDFPRSFSAAKSGGIKPIGSHLRYVPDFCEWNGKLVLATDETSIQGNRLAGQPQSNLWFGNYDDLRSWGPASGYGGPWIEDQVKAGQVSDPFLVAGFDRRVIHFVNGRKKSLPLKALRASDQQEITEIPETLRHLPRVSIPRGDWHEPAAGYRFTVEAPVTVFLAVDQRGDPTLDPEWQLTDMTLRWGRGFRDRVYMRKFRSGTVVVPGNPTEHTRGSFGMPHTAFLLPSHGEDLSAKGLGQATVTNPETDGDFSRGEMEMRFLMEVDRNGTGNWQRYDEVPLAAGQYRTYLLPKDFDSTWVRFTPSHDCVATVVLHQTTSRFVDGQASQNQELFQGLAGVTDVKSVGGRIYAAKRNRNLRMIDHQQRFFEFTKAGFEFKEDEADEKLSELLETEQEFTVDEASVVLKSQGRTYRLPKGDHAFDRPFEGGWPRVSREVESERHLANIHGTFYEVPLVTNGSPPAWNLMRPVSSHAKKIDDFCTWNGLLVLSGIRHDAFEDGHVFRDERLGIGLWFGGIDDLWKLGKPVGRGGPWLNSQVKAGVSSDPYLMKGYDRKSVSLSHDNSSPLTITLEVDIDGAGLWVDYKSFDIAAGEVKHFDFPAAFSACWIRARSDDHAIATVQFLYQ